MARIYRNIIHFRQHQIPKERQQKFPYLHYISKSKYLGKAPIALGLFLILVCMVISFPCSGDPMSCSKVVNSTFYALSRPVWTFGVLLVLFGIIMG